MTMLNVWITPGAGHMISDGAIYRPDGALEAIVPKLITFCDLRAVVGMMGRAFPLIAEFAIKTGAVLDESNLGPSLAGAVRSLYEENERALPGDPENHLSLTAVVWNDQRGPVAWHCGSGGRVLLDGMQPFVSYSGGIGFMHPQLRKKDWPSIDWDALTPEADAVRIAQIQRRLPRSATKPQDFPVVGGFVDAVTVTATGVQRQVLHIWPDVVGEQISI